MRPEAPQVHSLKHSVRILCCLVLAQLLLLLSACKAGDIGSSSSSSSASVDNSEDDHSVTGSTHCTLTVSVEPINGVCGYSRDCDGATVEAGEFPATVANTCVLPTPAPESEAATTDTTTTDTTTGTLNQSGAL